MTHKVNIMVLMLFALHGQSQDQNSENSGSGGKEAAPLKRIQIKDTYSTTDSSSDNSSTNSGASTQDSQTKAKGTKKFSREDFIRGRVELDPRIIQRSFFFGRNVFPSKFEGDADLYRGTQIAENTFSGSSLVYNCEYEYWSCVSTEDANKCIEKRDNQVKKYEKNYSCAFLKRYVTNQECEQKQLELIAYSNPSILCFRGDD